MFAFSDVLEEFYIFAVIMYPFQMSFLAPYISLLDWRLKLKDMTECLEIVDFTENFS